MRIDYTNGYYEGEVNYKEEQHGKGKFIYKNGDKGSEYFSVVYKTAFRRYNFYPDYIIETTNGEIWIIETKGGEDKSGNSQDIDKFSPNINLPTTVSPLIP